MAVYDRNADAATAVTAFLAQYTLNANGNIRFSAGTDSFHVWWLHRALQKKVWDFAVSGDDNLNLAKPNPSTSEALGTIITLVDHTTNYATRYNIDDTVAQQLFGGSVEQQNASSQLERYSGLRVLGSVNNPLTELQLVQNNALLASHWGTGKNQTDANTLLRVLVKTFSAGAEIDNSVVITKASEWQDTYAIWETTLGLGESVAAINTASDPQNTTALLTVQGYTGFAGVAATLEGYQQIDVDGLGADNFLGAASYASLTGNQNKKALYEVVKAYLTRGTVDTVFGIDGDLWTGRVYDVTVTPGAGVENWVQNETISWGTGTGVLLAADNLADASTTRIILHLTTGVPPVNTDVLTGATASNVATAATKLTTAPNILGLFTGTNWIGAFGIGFAGGELTFGDAVTSLDGETPTVPQNVTVTINVDVGLAGDDPHVFIAEKDPVLEAPDYTVYTAASGNLINDPDIVVNEAIASDEPQDGWLGVLVTGQSQYKFYHYSSWTGSTFTLDATDHPGGLDEAITLNDPAFVAIIYASATGGGVNKSVSNSYIYSADKAIRGWVRHGDPASPDRPVLISANVGSNGFTTTVVLDDES